MNIGEKTFKKATNQIEGLFRDYEAEINRAFLKTEDALSVGLKVVFSPSGEGVQVESEMSFVMEKVKAKSGQSFVVENQGELDL